MSNESQSRNYDNYSTRTFNQDYPNSPHIVAIYESGGITIISWYNVISLGHYPKNVIMTQKNSRDGKQHWIPNDYIVETEIGNRKLRCEIKYTLNQKAKYIIFWDENDTELSVYSERSATGAVMEFLKEIHQTESRSSGPRVFGLDIGRLHQCRLEAFTASATPKKRPLSIIQTKSGQNKRFAAFGKDCGKELSSLIKKHHMTTETGQPIVYVRNIELDFNGETVNLSYQNNIEPKKLDAIVRACDESLLARDGYRQLSAVECYLIREYRIEKHRIEITNTMNNKIRIGTFSIDNNIEDFDVLEQYEGILVEETEIGNGVYRSIQTLLKVLISVLKNTSPPILNQGDTINLKIGGDGRNVGRKQKHVMITFCILNEKKEVLKPDHQYCFCLYVGCEKYDDLAKIGKLFQYQLSDLKDNGIIDQNDIHWPIELFFCGDWKFMYIIMGLSAPNSKYFCLYCDCDASSRWDMDKMWNNTGNTKCEKKPSLFPAINQENYIPDELHLFLRISDVLMECFFSDLIKKKEFQKEIKPAIEVACKNIKIHFEFFQSKSTGKQWNWTSLMGPDKKKMLEKFPVSQFIPGIRGKDVEELWREFYRLYLVLHEENISDQEIDQFAIDAENWVRMFCRPTKGHMNSANQIPGLYRKEDITPYMHVFAKHIPQFLRQLKEKGLSLQIFSTSSIEKKNHNQVRLFFGGTTMGGGTDGKSVVYNIMSFENRQLFYLINNTPKKFVARNIDANDKEN